MLGDDVVLWFCEDEDLVIEFNLAAIWGRSVDADKEKVAALDSPASRP